MAFVDGITELNGYLDHNPDLKSYRDRVKSEYNAAMQEFCGSQQWLFLHKTAIFSTLAPVEGDTGITVTVTSGEYNVLVSGIQPSTSWEGHIFFAPDGEEYEIARVVASNSTSGTIYLMTRYAGDTEAGSTDWAVRFLQYALPVDCDEVLSIFDLQTKMPLPFISRGRDEMAMFNRLSAAGPLLAVDTIQRVDRGPDYAPTLAAAAGGNLVSGHTYAVCVTYTVAGRESAPGPAATLTVSGGNLTIAISGLEDTREFGDITGIYKKVYVRDVTAKGRFLCVNPLVADQLADATTTLNVTDLRTSAVSYRESNELVVSEPYRQYLRFDPPMGDARRIEIRYKRKVRDLVADSDIPPVPPPFERIIVFRAVRRMCASIGATGLWNIWKAEADDLERACRAVHLTRANLTERRRSIKMPGAGTVDPRWLGTMRVTG